MCHSLILVFSLFSYIILLLLPGNVDNITLIKEYETEDPLFIQDTIHKTAGFFNFISNLINRFMFSSLKNILWQQFGASIDMLENALVACPDDLWNTESKFWYMGYHTLFYLDYYLSDAPGNFMPPAPFTLSELDPAGVLPERV